jgi:hypothetical protein
MTPKPLVRTGFFFNSSMPMWLLRDVELVRALEKKAMLLVDEVV